MDGCSDAYNLTDCLLQQVLETIKDHNRWDVPTFSITLVIGVVALTFAAMTVIQGVLSAGPGRRKCSEAAIGNWSRNTKRHWNLAELRRDSLAYTPVLTSGRMRRVLERLRAIDAGEIRAISDRDREFLPDHREQEKDTVTPIAGRAKHFDTNFPATWLNLLNYTNLDRLVWVQFEEQTKQTAADYLPSEVQAVPAFMDVDTIVSLAALAGCDVLIIDPESGYPLMSGATVQIHFRRDPFLGWVASFERYEFEGDAGERPWMNFTMDKFPWRRLFRDPRLRLENTRTRDLLLPIEASKHSPLCCRRLGRCRGLLKPVRGWSYSQDMPEEELTTSTDISWLLDASAGSVDVFADVFPVKSAGVEGLLGTIVVQGSYWSKDHLDDQDILSKLKADRKDWDWNKHWFKFGHRADTNLWMLFGLCLHFAVDVRLGKGGFRQFLQNKKRELRFEIRNEVARIDDEIKGSKTGTEESLRVNGCLRCTMLEISIRSAALMDLEPFQDAMTILRKKEDWEHSLSRVRKSKLEFKTARNVLRAIGAGGRDFPIRSCLGPVFSKATEEEIEILAESLYNSASRLEKTGKHAEGVSELSERPTPLRKGFDTPIDLMKGQDDPMLELIIYRTNLVAIHCLTSLDDSEILERGIGNQVVAFL